MRRPLAGRAGELARLLADHQVFDTRQVAGLFGVSRVTAHRLLNGMCRAGLVERVEPSPFYYVLSTAGWATVGTGRVGPPTPVPGGDLGRQAAINSVFVDLIAYGRGHGAAGLWRWRSGPATIDWLRRRGAARAASDGSAVWVQDNTAVTFNLHWAPGPDPRPLARILPAVAATYRGPRFVQAALVVCAGADAEAAAHNGLAGLDNVQVVTTTALRLAATPAGAAGPIWATRPDAADAAGRVPLVVLGQPAS